jgi:UDP-4-amino-4,6-dideoxy-N-acetyl-beta-L-altrosamine transaminase
MIPYGRQSLDDDDINAVVETLKSNFLTQGAKVPTFELAIANYVAANYAIATSSATAALHVACLALELMEKDIGWTVPLTFAASANAIRYCGATIDFVDIDIDTGCICIKALAEKLQIAKANGKLPKVLIVVHYSGISCNMQAIAALCQPHQIKVIEDASHAIGGSYNNKPVGCCEFSDCTIFSFHPVKIITTGEGGMITTNNPYLAEQCKLLRSHGIHKNIELMCNKNPEPWFYEQQSLGFNYRMSDIHAALGLSQLGKLDSLVNIRNQQSQRYKEALAHLPVEFLHVPEGICSSWHLFVIRVDNTAHIGRSRLYKLLIDLGIGCQVHYIPVHTHPYYQELGFTWGDFPNAETFYDTCLSIPIFPDLREQNKIVKTLISLLE